ncbi:hypothetical protein [Brunnivagina elsteri]|nr:hypothetical protein [Calothrix elsteri]
MRESVTPLLPNNLNIQIIAKDLCKLKALEIYEYLAAKNILPAHKFVS